MLLAAIDVQYQDNEGFFGLVLFESWQDEKPLRVLQGSINPCQPYEPGNFFRRELPVIEHALRQRNELKALPDVLIIDGHVDLEPGRGGLGRHVFDAYNAKMAVIGVAKAAFGESKLASEVFRGKSTKPLFITSAGISQKAAAQHVKQMSGSYRLPTLIKLADQVARKAAAGST